MLTQKQINKLKTLPCEVEVTDNFIELNFEFIDPDINRYELQNRTYEYFIKQYKKQVYYHNFNSIYDFYKTLDDDLRNYIYEHIITENLYNLKRADMYNKIMELLEISYEKLEDLLYEELEVYISFNQIYNICFATPIYGAMTLANQDDFDMEFGEDSYNFFNYEDKEEYNNQTNRFLTKNHLKANDIDLDNPPELILEIHDSLIQAGSNNTLCYPTVMRIKDLISAITDKNTLVISPDINTLGYHDYIFGSGSLPISKHLIEFNNQIEYQPKQWMFVPENTYGYDLTEVYDYKPKDFFRYENIFKINNQIKSFHNHREDFRF